MNNEAIETMTIENAKEISNLGIKMEQLTETTHKKLDGIDSTLGKILDQTTKTNGRVNRLERECTDTDGFKKDLETVRFMSRKKWAVGIVCLAAYAVTIKEFRDILIDIIF